MFSPFSADSRNCGPGRRESQARPIRFASVSSWLASLDFGLVQYQYELKLFKWTIQSKVEKMQIRNVQIFTLYCTGYCTVLPWGIYFLERVGVLLLSLTSEKLFSIDFFI